ncbi:unnamed protein product [Oikopleura dioica]|uniref:Uncharacterized protein n=1 Tax=Oikopleura dioica TaxID=34765 RepID=E4XXM6_OIKDI|nr:unnamed protein product [Oikopleura dioica]
MDKSGLTKEFSFEWKSLNGVRRHQTSRATDELVPITITFFQVLTEIGTSLGDSNCATSGISFWYEPNSNNDEPNFWKQEAPVFKNPDDSTLNNLRFKKGAEGWNKGDYVLSQDADGSWSIIGPSSTISLSKNACVTGDHANSIKVSQLASDSKSCHGNPITAAPQCSSSTITMTSRPDQPSSSTTDAKITTAAPPLSSTSTAFSKEQCDEDCRELCAMHGFKA